MKDNYIKKSIWDLQSQNNWESLEVQQWKDFILDLLEAQSQLNAQGIDVYRGKTALRADTELDVTGILSELLSETMILENATDMSVAVFVSSINFYEWLLYLLPWYDKINVTFQELCKVIDISFRFLEEQIARIERNLDIEYAIEYLGYFEKLLGIKTNIDLSYKQRRNQIQASMNAMHQQITEARVKEIVRAYSSNDAGIEVARTDTPYVFDFKFTSGGLPNNMDGLNNILEKVLPADLDWRYSYTQNTWEDAITDENGERLRWIDMRPYTWAKINKYRGDM